MRILVYEFATGGGLYGAGELSLAAESLLTEGQAMVSALAADFLATPNVEVVSLRDKRLAHRYDLTGCHFVDVSSDHDEWTLLRKLAADCNWSVVIAPEFHGILLDRCRHVECSGGRLLGPGPEFVELTADKQLTAIVLSSLNIAVPVATRIDQFQPLPPDFPYPAVIKPVDGAGSMGLRRINGPDELSPHDWVRPVLRMEQFCPGAAASASVLAGPRGAFCLPPCFQHISGDGLFGYSGGQLIADRRLAERAETLMRQLDPLLAKALGYVGVDMILGEPADGTKDVVIEINPRLTTSYIGLRAAANCNLASCMLEIAEGRSVELSFSEEPIEFGADGSLS